MLFWLMSHKIWASWTATYPMSLVMFPNPSFLMCLIFPVGCHSLLFCSEIELLNYHTSDEKVKYNSKIQNFLVASDSYCLLLWMISQLTCSFIFCSFDGLDVSMCYFLLVTYKQNKLAWWLNLFWLQIDMSVGCFVRAQTKFNFAGNSVVLFWISFILLQA